MAGLAEAESLDRQLERLVALYRQIRGSNKTPLEAVLHLSSQQPDSLKIQQIVLKNCEQTEENDDDDESLLYITKILVGNQFPFEAVDASKTKSVEKASDQAVHFLAQLMAEQERQIMQIWAMQSLMNQVPYYGYEDSDSDLEDVDYMHPLVAHFPSQKVAVTTSEKAEHETVDRWAELVNLFISVHSESTSELELLDKAAERGLLTVCTEPVGPLKVHSTTITITGCIDVKFSAVSKFDSEDSKRDAALKLVAHLSKLSQLIDHFKAAYQSTREPFKLVLGLIRQNSSIIKMIKSSSNLGQRNPKHSSTKIDIVNVLTVEEFGVNCGDVAAEKIVDILKRLARMADTDETDRQTNASLLKSNSSLIETIEIVENAPSTSLKTENEQKSVSETVKVPTCELQTPKESGIQQAKDASQQQSSGCKSDDHMKGIKSKLANMKEVQLKKNLVKIYKLASAQKKTPLEIIDILKSNGINLEVSQTTKKSHVQTKIKFRGFTGGNLPEFYDNSRKKLDSKRAAAIKLVAYLRKLAYEDGHDSDNLPADEGKSAMVETNETNLEALIERFKSLNVLKQTQLEILDMLKSKGEPIEIEHSFENDNHQTIIKIAGIEFCSTAPKKADSKRIAANKVVEYLKTQVKRQVNASETSDTEANSEEESENEGSEREEEPIVKLRANIVKTEQHSSKSSMPTSVPRFAGRTAPVVQNTPDNEPLWGPYESKSPFIVNQQRRAMSRSGNTMTIEELEAMHFGADGRQQRQLLHEGPSEEKIKELIMLIKRFDRVNSKSKGKLQVLNELKSEGQSLRIYRTVNKNPTDETLIFHVSVTIEGIAFFEENSPDKKHSEAYALIKTIRFLKNLSHLVKNFLFFYSRTKYPTEIIESLMIKNFEMLAVVEDKQQSDGQHKVAVQVTNIALYTGVDREAVHAREIAMTKVCYLILKLAGINGTLKVKDYIALRQWTAEPRRIVTKKPVVQTWSDSEEDEEEDEDEETDGQHEQQTYLDVFKKNLAPAVEPESETNPTSIEPTTEHSTADRMLWLIQLFRSAPNHDSATFDSQWSVLEHLRAEGAQIRIISDIINKANAQEYLFTIDIKDVATFPAQDKSEQKSKEKALVKMMDFLKNISHLVESRRDKQPAEEEAESEKENDQSSSVDENSLEKDTPKTNHMDILLNLFKTVYTSKANPAQILDILIAKTSTEPDCANLIQVNHISLGQQCISTINLGGENFEFIEVFSGTGSEAGEAKSKAAIKFVHHLSGMLERQLEQQLDLRQLIKDPNLVLESSTSRAIYEAVKAKWLSSVNPIAQFKALAAFVITSDADPALVKVLSIGTGTQSIASKTDLPYSGQLVLDCHAEVMARRALLCYLYDQIDKLMANQANEELILEYGTSGFRLKPNLKLHLYLSSRPCAEKEDKFGLFKPCADKIKCWNVLGVQGAVLGSIMEPLYLSSVTVSDLTGFDKLPDELYDDLDLSLLQAMLDSLQLSHCYRLNRHKIGYYRLVDDNEFHPMRVQEYPVSHNWYRPLSPEQFIPVELVHAESGKLLSSQPSQPSRLSKQALVLGYQELIQKYPVLLKLQDKLGAKAASADPFALYYRGLKNRSTNFQQVKTALKDTFAESTALGEWIQTPLHVDLFMI